MEKDLKYFAKGALDSDSVNIAVQKDSWVNAENVRTGSTDKGFTERMESVGGTLQISAPQPSVTFLEIGSATDEENNRLVYFLFNTTGTEHKIVCYDANSDVEYNVLLSSQVTGGLNFSKDVLIHSARIINGLLYWVEGTNNQPRKINIDSAIKANYPSFSTDQQPYTFPLTQQEITIIKEPPAYPPNFIKVYDAGFGNNFIANYSFEAAFQFIYYDNEETVTGVYSAASRLNFVSDTFNKITYSMAGNQIIPSTVRIVNLVLREQNGDIGGGNIAKVIKTWDKKNSSDATEIENQNNGTAVLSFDFYNNLTGAFLDKALVLKPYDNVPIYSQSLEAAKNRIFLGNNIEGYDTPEQTSMYLTLPDKVNLGVSTQSLNLISISAHENSPVDMTFWGFGGLFVYLTVGNTPGYYLITSSQSYLTSGSPGVIIVPLPNPLLYPTVALSGLTFMGVTKDEVLASICRRNPYYPNSGYPATADSYAQFNYTTALGVIIPSFTVLPFSTTVTGMSTTTYNLFLPKSTYRAGIVFYDFAMRKCGVCAKGNIGLLFSQDDVAYSSIGGHQLFVSTSLGQKLQIGYQLTILTGTGAGTYTITAIDSSTIPYTLTVKETVPVCSDSSTIEVYRLLDDIVVNTPTRNYAYSQGLPAINWNLSNENTLVEIPDWAYYYAPVRTLNLRTRFFIDSIITASNPAKYVTKDTNGVYQFTNDVFTNATIGIGLNTAALVQSNLGYVFNEGDICILIESNNTRYELPVIGQAGNYIILKSQDIGNLSNRSFVYEIYTPYQQSEQEVYYEIGQLYPINNPTTADREYSVLFGSFAPDTYALTRNFTNTTYYASAMCPNDLFYQRWDNDGGKPNIVTLLGQTNKTQYIRWSNVFIPNTAVNGLSTFEALNQIAVPQNCGSISKLILTSKIQEEGTIMLAICNEEAASLYLEEVRLTDSTGRTQFLGVSTEVVGTINVLKGSFGTVNPESVVEYRGNVFWFDANNGRMVQYSLNGLYPISNYNMTRFWKLWAAKYKSMRDCYLPSYGKIYIDTLGDTHDLMEVFIDDPDYGVISLGVYEQSINDTTTSIYAQNAAQTYNSNPYGYIVTYYLNQIIITARSGVPSSINVGDRISVVITPYVATGRITEDGNNRITENNNHRIIE